GVADVVLLATDYGKHVTVPGNPRVNIGDFESACEGSIAQALNGQPKVDTVSNGERLFDIVALPIRANGGIVGGVTFGAENSITTDFKSQLKGSELILLSDGHVLASTLRNTDLHQ